MKRMNMLIVMLSTVVLSCGHGAIAQDRYTAEYGVTEGKPVDKGIVFVDGKYISSPYVISRRGLTLYVNDHEIRRPRRHIETPVLTGDIDPSRLSGQDRQRLFRALDATRGIYEDRLSRGYGYLFSSKGGHVKLSPYAIGYELPKVVELLTSGESRDEKQQKLQHHNWQLYIDVSPFLDDFTPSAQLVSRMAQQTEEMLRIDMFGISEPLTVTEGFVFLHGRYVEPPYVLQRRGLGVFLNGKLFTSPQQWSEEVRSGDTDVPVPAEINAETSWFDDNLVQYLAGKKAYLFKHYPAEQARGMVAQAIAALPLVTKTQRDKTSVNVLNVTTTEGLTIPHSLSGLSPRAPQDRNSVLQSVQAKTTQFYDMLSKGVCFLMFDGGWTCLPPVVLDRTLPQIVDVLRSGQPDEAKCLAIKELRLGIPDRAIEETVNGFSPSAELEARIAAMSRRVSQVQR